MRLVLASLLMTLSGLSGKVKWRSNSTVVLARCRCRTIYDLASESRSLSLSLPQNSDLADIDTLSCQSFIIIILSPNPHHLHSLPTISMSILRYFKVWWYIAQHYLDRDALKTLRQVCLVLRNAIARLLFSSIILRPNLGSFGRAKSIANHPQYRQHVRFLILRDEKVYSPHVERGWCEKSLTDFEKHVRSCVPKS